MIDFPKEEKEFKNIISRFEEELKKIRTGRATSSVLEGILVESYGVQTPLMHAAALSSPDPKSVLIRPWDKNLLPAIEQALARANLGLSIISESDQVRVVFPALTEERRKEFVKMVGKKAEEARISVRQRRDEIWKTIQEEERAKIISETQKYSQKEKMEKMVEEVNKKIAELAEKKEKEIMSI
ncbi:ribosome recycling factor [Candidatus Giovannonibacteria bacterium RIFCSPLOWO2_12_FULL_44_25]|uniref:Ribosome-recycling factor n=2 Tax=Candidatus Giovannoniibacteriota TaxID=1752738 RepID=A0A1F5WBM4_9BACT|nr:MAG: ribosome recycling factor [Parcubacteria group bacterium GW2011_GWC1_44_10]KKT59739.1 MAG: ribosome recycling factor [Candidatus Giovannonibacteria bacterium GW2011_GWA1_44_25]KKU29617.1 MAG: ribosome recycling factor [Candidatus Giovannonibacteria bacterium GW2011_GWB1_46_20]OGF50326.1 MAG: ribosome recycling factor [Candidatus Giovannonibacteria bacterium GWA2_45_15]OGF60132.1 MAG: ribosome recycling factor [Candidatus Giovannonibacteria bacterium RIFCSPHIGHO2_01_45_12]OGF60858.1 MAG